MEKTKTAFSAKEITSIALMAAIIAVMAQITIPLPGGVPFTMQTCAIMLAGIVLGSRRGGIATLVYVLLGTVGVPVFAGLRGGVSVVAGPTGGFLIGFPVMAVIVGLGIKLKKEKGMAAFIALLVLGITADYVIGVVWFVVMMKSTFTVAITACVIPFIIPEIIKAVLASVLGIQLRKRLAGMLED